LHIQTGKQGKTVLIPAPVFAQWRYPERIPGKQYRQNRRPK